MSNAPPKSVADMTPAEFEAALKAKQWATPPVKPTLPDAKGLTAEEFEKQMQRIKEGYYS
jgi:hypothetical protein